MTKKLVKNGQLGDDPILMLEIPNLNVLGKDLGFNDTDSQKNFRDSVTKWRKGYKTTSGKRGTALLDWDSAAERYDLGVMAQHFVEAGSNAHDFWPSDGGSSAQVRPRYPNDNVKILQLLRKFMWRQNKYLAQNKSRNGASVNGARSDSEDYSPPQDRSSYNAATGLQPNSASDMGDLPMGHRDRPRLPRPKLFALPEPCPASPGSPSNLSPGSAYYAPATGSSNMSQEKGNSKGDIQGQSSRHHPPLSGSNYIVREASKGSRVAIPPDAHHMSLQMSADAASDFGPRSTNSALATTTSDVSPVSEGSRNREDNTRAPSLQHESSHQTPLGSNDAGNEVNHQDRTSTPSQLHSPASQSFASGSEPLRNLNNQPDDLSEAAQPGNSDSPQGQANLSATTVRPEVGIFIVESSGPQMTIKEWPGPSLRDRTLKSIFHDHMSRATPPEDQISAGDTQEGE